MRSKRESLTPGFLILLALWASSCVDSRSVSQGGVPAAWAVGPDPLLVLGEVEGDQRYLFSRIAEIRILPDGGLLVADGASGTIRLYAQDGSFRTQMGGVGEGPGEFVYLSRVAVEGPDTIVVYDSQSCRLTRFLLSGELIGTVSFQAPRGYPELYLGHTTDGDHVLAWIKQVARDRTKVAADEMEVGRFEPGGGLVASVLTMPGMRRLRSPIPFSPHFLAVGIQDTLFVADGLNGVITVSDLSGRVARTIQVPAEPPSLDEAWQLLEGRLGAASDSTWLRVMREAPRVDSVPTFSDMLVDDVGQLWVKKYAPATDSHLVGRERAGGSWLVLDVSGALVATVDMPAGVRLMDVRAGRVAGLSRDSLGVERVHLYELHHGVPAA